MKKSQSGNKFMAVRDFDTRKVLDEQFRNPPQEESFTHRKILRTLGVKAGAWRFERFKKGPGNLGAYEACFEFTKEIPPTKSLYIFGKVGVGKTMLAACLWRTLLEGGFYGKFITAPEFFRGFRKLDPQDESDLVGRYSILDLWVLDDLGAGRGTDFSWGILCEILDRRIMLGKKGLVITGNLSLDALAQACGDDRIPSRLTELCDVVEVRGADGRMEKMGMA